MTRLNLSVFAESNNVQDKLTHYGRSNVYLLGKRMLRINVFFDVFSAYRSFTQNNWRAARNIDNGGTGSARSIAQINDSVDFIADLFSNLGSSCAFGCTG